MPGGKVHDAITILLAPPAFAICCAATADLGLSVTVTAAFLFGGFMFGPDLDTMSKQYSRWSIFRFVWFPYRSVFKHRSRWSHGLIFGTFFRVVYCFGIATIAGIAAYSASAWVFGSEFPNAGSVASTWEQIGEIIHRNGGVNLAFAAFFGTWAGAASHTFTDMAGSYIKTGRVMDFL